MAVSVTSLARPLVNVGSRRVRLVVCTALAVLLVAELGARLLAAAGAAPDNWNVTGVAVHIEQMRALARANVGRDTAVLVGSSVVGSDVDPTRLSAKLPNGAAVYNAWLPGAPARADQFVTDALALPILRPKLVVVGVTPRDLNDSGAAQARMYDALLSSPEARRLTGTESLSEKAASRVSTWSVLFRLRSVLRNPSAIASAIRSEGSAITDANIAANGMDIERLNQPLQLTQRHLDQERQAVSPFNVGVRELPALVQMSNRLRSEGVRVVVVNMPVLNEVYFGMLPGGAAAYDQYRATLQSSLAAGGVEYLDLGAQPWDRKLFADEDHLNGTGATRLTDIIGAAISGGTPITGPANPPPAATEDQR